MTEDNTCCDNCLQVFCEYEARIAGLEKEIRRLRAGLDKVRLSHWVITPKSLKALCASVLALPLLLPEEWDHNCPQPEDSGKEF